MTESHQMEFEVSSILAMGTRSRQEDAVAIAFPEKARQGFAILSDGMGGHASGDLASRTIVAEMFAALTLGDLEDAAHLPSLLNTAITKANSALMACVNAQPPRKGMGGTVIAVVAANDNLHWISSGDSVLYLFRRETLSRLNEDHSMAPEIDLMLERGMLTAEQAANHPQRNCLKSALMGEQIAAIDCPLVPLALKPDDIVILASDGLQFLPERIIEALLLRARRETTREIALDLMEGLATLNDPDQDNTAIVVVRAKVCAHRTRQSPIRSTSAAILKVFRRAVASPVHASARR